MTLFTWLIDLAIINAFALLKTATSSIPTLREFKRRIADTLTSNEKDLRRQRLRREALDEVVGADTSFHIVTPSSTKYSNGKLT
ncbi:hypothetical protein PI125_g22766 [Phytophthora idaei]|nr:hypothetical protein PI125_g22766 [Phytophthora idaei]